MTEIEKRILVDAYENTRNNLEYTKQIENIIELGQKIIEQLGSQRLLFLEYKRLVGFANGIHMRNVYSVGLEDGQKLFE